MDEEIFSFRYLDHPAITSLVPYIRRGNHSHAANPAYLAELVDRALPVIVCNPFFWCISLCFLFQYKQIHSENATNIPGSDLLDTFLAAIISLAYKVNNKAALVIVNLLRSKYDDIVRGFYMN
jgi:hypothetical protein